MVVDFVFSWKSYFCFIRTKIVNVGEIDKNYNFYDFEIWIELGLYIYKKYVYVFIIKLNVFKIFIWIYI